MNAVLKIAAIKIPCQQLAIRGRHSLPISDCRILEWIGMPGLKNTVSFTRLSVRCWTAPAIVCERELRGSVPVYQGG